MDMRPINTELDYERALSEMDSLMDAKVGTDESERLDALATLVEAYECQHYPLDPPDAVSAIVFHMEQTGATVHDLAQVIGRSSLVEEILAGNSQLSEHMISGLSERFGIPAESLGWDSRGEIEAYEDLPGQRGT